MIRGLPTREEAIESLKIFGRRTRDIAVSGLADNIWKNPVLVNGAAVIRETLGNRKADYVALREKDQEEGGIIGRTLNNPIVTKAITKGVGALNEGILTSEARLFSLHPEVTFREAYKSLQAGPGTEASFGLRVTDSILKSGPQTAIGVALSFIPYAGVPLATTYWAAISADEQIKSGGKVTNVTDIGIDVALDSVLGASLGVMFKSSASVIRKTVQSALTEGGTEVTQSLLKFFNHYNTAKTDEEKAQVIDDAKRYIKSGDIAVEFAAGAASGGGIGLVGDAVTGAGATAGAVSTIAGPDGPDDGGGGGGSAAAQLADNDIIAPEDLEDFSNYFREHPGISPDDFTKRYPNFQLKRAVKGGKDQRGKEIDIPKGETISAYQMKGNKVMLNDGEVYEISKNQLQNLQNNSNVDEARPFGTVLPGVKEDVRVDVPGAGPAWARKGDRPGVSKFSQYQIPGAQNYTETIHKVEGFNVPPDDIHFDDAASWHRANMRTINGEKYYGLEEIQKGKYLDETPGHPLSKGKYIRFELESALKEAAAADADYFTWTTGEQQAARYDATRVVSKMRWETGTILRSTEFETEGKTVYATLKSNGAEVGFDMLNDGEIVVVGGGLPDTWEGRNVREVFDKELSDKLTGKPSGTLKGKGLKIGGQWAKNLYDLQVKNEVQDILRGPVEMKDLGLSLRDMVSNAVFTDTDGKVVNLTQANAEVGMEVEVDDVEGGSEFTIANVYKNGKIKWVPRDWVYKSKEDAENTGADASFVANGVRMYYDESVAEFYDLKREMSAGQPVIKLTPEMKAKIRGESVVPEKVRPRKPTEKISTADTDGRSGVPSFLPMSFELDVKKFEAMLEERHRGNYVTTTVPFSQGKAFVKNVIESPDLSPYWKMRLEKHLEAGKFDGIKMYGMSIQGGPKELGLPVMVTNSPYKMHTWFHEVGHFTNEWLDPYRKEEIIASLKKPGVKRKLGFVAGEQADTELIPGLFRVHYLGTPEQKKLADTIIKPTGLLGVLPLILKLPGDDDDEEKSDTIQTTVES